MNRRLTKRRKIVISVFMAILLLYVITLLWLLPAFLKAPVNTQLKQNNLRINYVRLWINPLTLNVHLKNATVEDLTGDKILEAKKIDIDWQLWPLLNRQIYIDNLFLKEAELHLTFDHNNRLISPFSDAPAADTLWQIKPGKIEVVNSSVTLQKNDQQLQLNHIDLQLNSADLMTTNRLSNQNALLRFETGRGGDFVLRQNNTDEGFSWEIKNWPLKHISQWLRDTIELDGQLTASGTLKWSANQLPVIQMAKAVFNIHQFNFPPYNAQQTTLNAKNLTIDFNSYQVNVGFISSPAGELTVHTDPINLNEQFKSPEKSHNEWQLQFNSIQLNNWQLTLQDKRPAVKARLKHFTIHTEQQQQSLDTEFQLTAPFSQVLNINAYGSLNPVQLQGNIEAGGLALEYLNPWLQAFESWQIDQGNLSVNSAFCLDSDGFTALGEWSIPQLAVFNAEQRIETNQTSWQSVGLDFEQQVLALNKVHSQTVDIYTGSADTDNQINHTPPASGQLWRVVIDENLEPWCEIKPL